MWLHIITMHLFVTAFAALLATANSYDAAAAITLAIDIYHSDFAHTIIGDCDFGADLKGCNILKDAIRIFRVSIKEKKVCQSLQRVCSLYFVCVLTLVLLS